jgi:hypothetical protein
MECDEVTDTALPQVGSDNVREDVLDLFAVADKKRNK